MTKTARSWWLVALLLGSCLLLAVLGGNSRAEEPLPSLLTGLVQDSQGQPVRAAKVTLFATPGGVPLFEASTQPDGRYALFLPEVIPDALIGASANMVAAGIADRAGHRISYAYFFKKGFPALLITVSLALLWLLLRFLVLV